MLLMYAEALNEQTPTMPTHMRQ
ncbi:hypothetical protein [Spirosoma telluris]